MNTLAIETRIPEALKVSLTGDTLSVDLSDGRSISVKSASEDIVDMSMKPGRLIARTRRKPGSLMIRLLKKNAKSILKSAGSVVQIPHPLFY